MRIEDLLEFEGLTAEMVRALSRMHARQVVEGAAPMLEGLAADDKRRG